MNLIQSTTNSKQIKLIIWKGYDLENISKIVMSILLYSACSVSMLFINKIAIELANNQVYFILLVQNLASVLLLRILEYWEVIVIENIEKDIKLRMATVISFVLMLVSSMKAISFVTIVTVIIFRNLNSILVGVCEEKLFPSKKSSKEVSASIFTISFGFLLYCIHDKSFSFIGYFWLSVHLISTCVNILSSKTILSNTGMNIISMSYYNNLLSLPLLLILVIFEHFEISSFGKTLNNFTPHSYAIILISSFVSFCLSITGFLVMKQISASSYIILNNVNKNASVAVGLIWFNQYTSILGSFGMILSLIGGWLYSFAKLRHSRDLQIKKK